MELSMSLQQIKELLEKYNLLIESNIIKDDTINYISFDSRDDQIVPSTLFFCKGLHYKEEYLINTLDKGVTCYIGERVYLDNINYFIVNDIRKAMIVVADTFYKQSYLDIETVGITGTKGKTTVTYFLKNILDRQLKGESAIISTIEVITGSRHEKSDLTTPEPLDLHKYFYETRYNNIKYLTMEVTSQSYKTRRVEGVKFKHGMFLNIGLDHISDLEHESFEDYFNCKLELIKNCDDMVINYNMDDYEIVKNTCIANNVKYITYGSTNRADYYYTNVIKDDNGLIFTVVSDKYKFNERFKINMLGIFNVENALSSIVMALNMGVDKNIIKDGLEATYIPGRMNIVKNKGITVIVDFAHNGLSFSKLYEAIKADFPNKNIISVGGIPGNRDEVRKRDFGVIVGMNSNKVIITTDSPAYDDPKDICNDIIKFMTNDNYEIILDRKEAIKKAIDDACSNDVVVLIGKGDETFQKINGKLVPYETDLAIAKEFLEKK